MSKRNQAILCGVVCSHMLILWMVFKYNHSLQLNQSDPGKRIQVQFVALSNILSEAQNSAAARAPSASQPSNKPVSNHKQPSTKPIEQPKVLATPVENSFKSQTTEPVVQQLSPSMDSQTAQTAKLQATTSTLASTNTATTDAMRDAKGGHGTAQQQAGKPDGDAEKNQQSHAASSLAPAEHIDVSKVDVLQLDIHYNDRDLQNQNRELLLIIYIDSKGKASNVIVKKSTGFNYLDQLVIKAVYRGKFKPHVVSGKAIPVKVEYPFQLRLSKR